MHVGSIDVSELKAALQILGFFKTDEEVSQIMKKYDTNLDGSLDYGEFLGLVASQSEELAGIGDKFKVASHQILENIKSTNLSQALPTNFDFDWEHKEIKAPGRDGLQTETTFKGFLYLLTFLECSILVLFGACCTFELAHENYTNQYVMYTGVCFMMFFGFGYLMTFLKRYGMGAVGFTMLLTVIGMQWGLLTEVLLFIFSYFLFLLYLFQGFARELYNTEGKKSWDFIHISLFHIIESLFLVAACLISFGAVIGKTSPLQLLVMVFFESIFYSFNKVMLLLGVVEFVDGKIIFMLLIHQSFDNFFF